MHDCHYAEPIAFRRPRRCFGFALHRGFQRGTHFLVEHEEVLYPLAFGCEPGTAIEPVYGTVEGLVGFSEIGVTWRSGS